MSGLLEETLSQIQAADQDKRAQAKAYIANLTMPYWALGRILDLAVDLAGIYRNIHFSTAARCAVVMAGDHGIVAEKVTNQPQCVTAEMVRNFAAGTGAISVLAAGFNVPLLVADCGVNADLSDLYQAGKVIDAKVGYGTGNFLRTAAMTLAQAALAVENGIRLGNDLAAKYDVVACGEMGIGNSSSSTAIACVLCDCADPITITGPGAGLFKDQIPHKAAVIREALNAKRFDKANVLDIIAQIGGFEIAGLCGLMLAMAARQKAVVVDGFITTAAALLAQAFSPDAVDYMILAHDSAEKGHRLMLQKLNKKALLNLELRLGEGTGAVMALPLLTAAEQIMNKMASFEQAQVTPEGIDAKSFSSF